MAVMHYPRSYGVVSLRKMVLGSGYCPKPVICINSNKLDVISVGEKNCFTTSFKLTIIEYVELARAEEQKKYSTPMKSWEM
jgi:hypothetical protein